MIPYSHVILEMQKNLNRNAKKAILIVVIAFKVFVNQMIFVTALSTCISSVCTTTVKTRNAKR